MFDRGGGAEKTKHQKNEKKNHTALVLAHLLNQIHSTPREWRGRESAREGTKTRTHWEGKGLKEPTQLTTAFRPLSLSRVGEKTLPETISLTSTSSTQNVSRENMVQEEGREKFRNAQGRAIGLKSQSPGEIKNKTRESYSKACFKLHSNPATSTFHFKLKKRLQAKKGGGGGGEKNRRQGSRPGSISAITAPKGSYGRGELLHEAQKEKQIRQESRVLETIVKECVIEGITSKSIGVSRS